MLLESIYCFDIAFYFSIKEINYHYILICTIFYLKQVLLIFSIHNILQILPILILFHDLIDFHQLFFADPSIQICDFFQTGNFAMLMLFHCLHKICSIHKTLVCTGIQPGKSLSKQLYIQRTIFQIDTVQICDFQFSTIRRFQIFCEFNNSIVIEIKTCHTVIALWMLRFFFDRNRFAVFVKLNNTKTLRIIYIVPNTVAPLPFCAFSTAAFKRLFKPCPVKILSPSTMATQSSPIKSSPMINA